MSTEIKQILAAFEKFETIIIHRHINLILMQSAHKPD